MADGAGPQRPEGRRCLGKKEIGDVLRTRYGEIPDMRWDDMRHWICDQTKALSEWVVRGTPEGGEPFAYVGCDLWEFQDGYVTKKGHILEVCRLGKLDWRLPVHRTDPLDNTAGSALGVFAMFIGDHLQDAANRFQKFTGFKQIVWI